VTGISVFAIIWPENFFPKIINCKYKYKLNNNYSQKRIISKRKRKAKA
jgi:hypothetical protein